MLEINQVLVVLVNLNVSECTPCLLDLLSVNRLNAFLSLFPSLLKTCAPRPLDLNRTDVVHRESMILEQASCQGHFVSGLNQSSAEILHATVFILGHYVERRSQELLAK